MSTVIIPASAIIPTAERAAVLNRTLQSLSQQDVQPLEIIIIDASSGEETYRLCADKPEGLISSITYLKASEKGAAVQRNQGVAISDQPFILFMDDDIVLEESCIKNLWLCMQTSFDTGGVSALITNQHYHPPGKATSVMYRIMHGKKLPTYSGMCIGPAWNLLPEDNNSLPEYMPAAWMNLGCTIYKKEVLPVPVFRSNFKGYSLMEDLALSLEVGKKHKLFNVRTARIYHDSQPGAHKTSVMRNARMELINRHFIMTHVLGRKKIGDHFKLFLFECWGITTVLTKSEGWKQFPARLAGKVSGIFNLIVSGK